MEGVVLRRKTRVAMWGKKRVVGGPITGGADKYIHGLISIWFSYGGAETKEGSLCCRAAS